MKIDALIKAVYRKNLVLIDESIKQGVDINCADEDGRTPLMHAVLASDSDARTVQFLMDRGANVDASDSQQQWTSLHFAARDQKTEIVKTLLEAGANVNAVDSFGNTPLWRCIFNKKVDSVLVKILLEKGAEPDFKNKSGVSPRDLARTIGISELFT